MNVGYHFLHFTKGATRPTSSPPATPVLILTRHTPVGPGYTRLPAPPREQAAFTGDKSSWEGKSVVSVSQFSTEGLQLLFEVAERMKAMVADKTDDATLRYAHMVAGVLDSSPARSLAECFSRGCGVAFLASFYSPRP